MISVAEPLPSPHATLYSLRQMRFVALCSIPFTACTNCCLLHYAVFPLQPAPTAVCCIMLYSIYSLHQLRFVELCCIPFAACSNCGLLHYAVFPLEPAPPAVCCITLYSLYSLHQLRFVALCCIPHTIQCNRQMTDNSISFEN